MSDIQHLHDLEKADESLLPTPEDVTLRALSKLTSAQLKQRLTDAGIKFEPRILKPRLQAFWAFHTLRILDDQKKPSRPELFVKTVRWFNIPVSELLKDVNQAGLGKFANKWDYIEALIQADYAPVQSKSNPRQEDKADSLASSLAKLEIPNSKGNIHCSVANLILSIVYSDVAEYQDTTVGTLLPGRNLSARTILASLNKLLHFKTNVQVQQSLKMNDSPETVLRAQLLAEFGDMFIPAIGNLKVPGIPESALQFILNKPPRKQLDEFESNMSRNRNKSILLFHGTSLLCLRSIIRQGFQASWDTRYGRGTFFAEDPYVSCLFAAGRIWQNRYRGSLEWAQSPYKGHGLLIGCEVAGNGRYVEMERGRVHVINKPEMIMIRYIILLPPQDINNASYQTLKRKAVESDMVDRFKQIRAGQLAGQL